MNEEIIISENEINTSIEILKAFEVANMNLMFNIEKRELEQNEVNQEIEEAENLLDNF